MTLRRLGSVVPLTLLAVAAAGVVVPSAAHAAIFKGSWTSPTAGATVGGTVSLSFSTQNTAVTFILPGTGRETATVSGGTATGTWNTVGVTNGTQTITAEECDQLTGCSDTSETVTVYNAPASTTPTPSPLPAPAPAPAAIFTLNNLVVTNDQVVHPGQTVTISGPSTSAGYVQDTLNAYVPSSLPYNYVVPASSTAFEDTLTFFCNSGCATASVVLDVVPIPTAPALKSVSAPRTFFPKKDGYQDNFTVKLSTDQTAVAHLYIRKGKKIVARGTASLAPYVLSSVSAGAGLKAGKYSWQVVVSGTSGKTSKTKVGSVTADPRHLVTHKVSVSVDPAQLNFVDLSGKCASAKKSGSDVVVTSDSVCTTSDPQDDTIGGANFFPGLEPAPAYGPITLAVTTSGDEYVLIVLQGATATAVYNRVAETGTTTAVLAGTVLSPKHHQLQFAILEGDGQTVTITHIHVSYSYKLLVK